MSFLGGLMCPSCGAELEVSVSYNGCDWEAVAGEGSGFGYSINLDCTKCPRTYPIGKVRNSRDFSENVNSKLIVNRLSKLQGI